MSEQDSTVRRSKRKRTTSKAKEPLSKKTKTAEIEPNPSATTSSPELANDESQESTTTTSKVTYSIKFVGFDKAQTEEYKKRAKELNFKICAHYSASQTIVAVYSPTTTKEWRGEDSNVFNAKLGWWEATVQAKKIIFPIPSEHVWTIKDACDSQPPKEKEKVWDIFKIFLKVWPI